MVKTYMFKVLLPGQGECWRKIEMMDDQTLEDLHFAIQDAFEFDNDHMYSFFMSGKAWDKKTEYSLPEGEGPWGGMMWIGADDQLPDNGVLLDDEVDDAEDLPEKLDLDEFLRDEIGEMTPDPQERETLLQTMKVIIEADDKTFDKLMREMRKEMGNDGLLMMMQLRMLRGMWQDMVKDIERDVRTVTIESLNLRARKKFLYLFDYGDEWRFTVLVDSINKNAPEGEYPKIVETVGKAPPQYPNWDEDEDDEWDEVDLIDTDEGEDGGIALSDDNDK